MSSRFQVCAVVCTIVLGWMGGPSMALAQGQDAVRVGGVVRDEFNAITLPGVPVEVVGTDQVVYTDVDGQYSVNLASGSHEIRLVLDGYEARTVMVDVAPGSRAITLDVGMSMTRFAESVTVTAEIQEADLATSQAQLVVRQRSSVITDNLASEEMRQNADSNAASAMQRVTGLSVVDNQFVFVRGLGERYSNTTLNGAAIPTTEPDKKVVPLDLFPAGLLSSVSVAKSYTPDRSADFVGGLVEIVPLKFPNRPVFDASWSIGFNSQTTGNDVIGTYAGGSDWRGFDDGTRALPATVPGDKKVIRGGIYTPDVGVLRSDLETIGEAFLNDWNLRSRSAVPNQSGGVTVGNNFGGKVGLMLSYTQSYKEQATDERQVFYRQGASGLSTFSDYDFQYATRSASVGGIANVSVQPTSTQRVTWENFYTHTGKDEARTFSGFNSDAATNLRDQRQFWVEEQLVSTGVSGQHFFTGNVNNRLDWRTTLSTAKREEPDLREVLYEENGPVFVLADESQSGFRQFSDLQDDTKDFSVSWSVFPSMNGLPAEIKLGTQWVDRTRDFDTRRFRLVPISVSGIDLTLDPESLYTSSNIGPGDNFELKEETRVTDAYAADQTTTSVFGMIDVGLSPSARVIAGARVERFDQNVDTFDPFDFEGDPGHILGSIQETDLFPAVNFVYSPRPDQNLRLSFSQTVNRPEFRELAPFEFTDIVGGRAVVGNPNLKRSLIQNYDVRYEAFPQAEEVIAASFFFKRFQDPIERIIEPTAQLRTSFTNADSARNVGVELEARKLAGEYVLVGANYTYVDSSITLTPAAAQVQTSLERPLAGQSKNLFNLLAEFRQPEGRASVRLLYNFFGARISDVGALGLPDIIQTGRGSLDIVASARVAGRINLRVSLDNLTNEDFEYTQDDLIQRLYKLGRTVSVNVGFSAF